MGPANIDRKHAHEINPPMTTSAWTVDDPNVNVQNSPSSYSTANMCDYTLPERLSAPQFLPHAVMTGLVPVIHVGRRRLAKS